MPENNLLIVGGTGFIGSHLAKTAIKKGYNVRVLSLQEQIKAPASFPIEYINADIRDFGRLKQALSDQKINYVVNLGGYVNHTPFLSGGYEVIDTHFNGVMNLCRCLRWENIHGFVQIGSSDEYGNQKAPQNESQRESPITPYSFGKTASNHFLQMLHREEGFPIASVRLFLVYGPEQGSNRFIPQIIQGCLEDRSFPVSLGEQLRDFCYVDDVVHGILLAMKNVDARGEVINIASGHPVQIKEVIQLIRDKIGKGHPRYGDVRYRKGENMELYADISKSAQLLSWRPEIDIKQGIEKTINYYKKRF